MKFSYCALEKEPEKRFLSIAAFAKGFQQAIQTMEGPTLLVTRDSAGVATVPSSSSSKSKFSDVYATLAISEDEARHGTTRTLTLSNGQRISVSIPREHMKARYSN